MTPDGTHPGTVVDVVGDLLGSALAADEHLGRVRLWRRAVSAIAAVPDPGPATRGRLAELVLEFGRHLRPTVDPFTLAEITGQAARLVRGDDGNRGLYAHAASSHAGALAVIDDDLSLSWFRESIATYRGLARSHAVYRAELDQVLVNVGFLHERAGRRALAVECLEEATDPSAGDTLSPDRRAVALTSALRCETALGHTERAQVHAGRLRDLLDRDSRADAPALRPRTRTFAREALASPGDATHRADHDRPATTG